MCIVCTEWAKGGLTLNEAKRNLGEMITSTNDPELMEHYFQIAEKILEENEQP